MSRNRNGVPIAVIIAYLLEVFRQSVQVFAVEEFPVTIQGQEKTALLFLAFCCTAIVDMRGMQACRCCFGRFPGFFKISVEKVMITILSIGENTAV